MDTAEVLCICSIHGKVKGFCTWCKILFCILVFTSPWNLMYVIRECIFPKLLRNRFSLILIKLFMSLSIKYTEPLKRLYYVSNGQRFKPRKCASTCETPRYEFPFLQLRPCTQTWRKKDGSSWLLKHFVWEQRQRPRSRFWIRRMTKTGKERERQPQKDTMKPSVPKNYFRGRVGETKAGAEGQTKWWRLGEYRKRWHISFICRENACLSKWQTIQCSHFFLFSM